MSDLMPVLRELHASQRLVDLRTRSDADLRCYIEEISDEYLLISNAGHSVTMEGFSVIRVDDVDVIKWDTERLQSWQAALVYDNVSRKRADPVPLDGWTTIVDAVAAQEKFIAFHLHDTDWCIVGCEVEVLGGMITCVVVTTEGERDGRMAFSADLIRRIDFGGPYERGLGRMSEPA